MFYTLVSNAWFYIHSIIYFVYAGFESFILYSVAHGPLVSSTFFPLSWWKQAEFMVEGSTQEMKWFETSTELVNYKRKK